MVSQINQTSSEDSFRKKRKAESSCSNSLTFHKKRMIFTFHDTVKRRMIPAFRNYPDGCGPSKRKAAYSETVIRNSKGMIPTIRNYPEGYGPWKRFATQFSQQSVQSEPPVSEFMPKRSAPRKRVMATRTFPRGCGPRGRFQAQLSEDLVQSQVPDSTPCYDSEFEDLMVSSPENWLKSITSAEAETPRALDDMERIDLENSSEYEATELSEEAELEFSSSRYDLGSEDSITSLYNISLESLGLSKEEEAIDMPKCIDSMGSIHQSETSESDPSIVSRYNIGLESVALSAGEEEEEEGIDKPKVINSMGFIDPSETSEHEDTDATEKTMFDCRRRSPQIREEDIFEATTSETNGLNHKLSDAEDPLLEVLRDSEERLHRYLHEQFTEIRKLIRPKQQSVSGKRSNYYRKTSA